MTMAFQDNMRGFTLVELMVTIVIVAVLAATVGTFAVKLLTLQEQDREEAYIREKLLDICASYVDCMSVGSSVTELSNQVSIVNYRQETGGVSFETGTVSRVTSLQSFLNAANGTVTFNVYGREGTNDLKRVPARMANGVASLIPAAGDIVDFAVSSPLKINGVEDQALRVLRVSAQHKVRKDNGKLETRITSVERVVRLWNHE